MYVFDLLSRKGHLKNLMNDRPTRRLGCAIANGCAWWRHLHDGS